MSLYIRISIQYISGVVTWYKQLLIGRKPYRTNRTICYGQLSHINQYAIRLSKAVYSQIDIKSCEYNRMIPSPVQAIFGTPKWADPIRNHQALVWMVFNVRGKAFEVWILSCILYGYLLLSKQQKTWVKTGYSTKILCWNIFELNYICLYICSNQDMWQMNSSCFSWCYRFEEFWVGWILDCL